MRVESVELGWDKAERPTRSRFGSLWVVMALTCWAAPAAAQGNESAPAGHVKYAHKVAVLEFPPEKAFDANTNNALNDFYASDLRKEGLTVITSADVTALLGLERQRELTGCTDSSCFGEIGSALGSDLVARGSVALLESSTALTLSLQDSRGGEVNRVSVRFQGRTAEILLAKLDELVPQLVQPLRDAGKLPPREMALASRAASSPGAMAVTNGTPSEPSHTASYVLFGVGGLAVLAGGVAGAVASPGYQKLRAAATGTTPLPSASTASSLRSSVGTEQIIFEAGIGAGVVAAGVGLVLYLMAPNAPVITAMSPIGGPGLMARF